jgi:hypothetical protein
VSTDHLYTTKASYDVMKSRAEARCAALEEEILRERESRKQAADERDFARGRATAHAITVGRLEAELSLAASMVHAAAQAADKAFNAGIEAAAKATTDLAGRHFDSTEPEFSALMDATHAIRDKSKPIPQEPAERERGK